MKTLLMVDNYDSFTFNLVQMFRCRKLAVAVHRSDRIGIERIAALGPDYIVISPGPKDPAHAGVSSPLIRAFGGRIPILGFLVIILLQLAAFVCFLVVSILGFVKGLAGERFHLPVLDEYAEKVPLSE